jgi:protein-S-isoprenylcysteine O-methyltransferase Ste14
LRFLELKIPPPLVALLVGAGMWALAQYTPRLELPITYRVVVGVVFAAVGIAIIVAGFVAFFRADTTIDPTRPQRTTALVTIGVYAFSRNPMYLGLLLLLVGWAVYLASPAALIGPLILCLYLGRFQIVPEERILAKLFGTALTDYCAKVRRWL